MSANRNRTKPPSKLFSIKPNGDLADKFRKLGLARVVDSAKVRRALGIPIRVPQTLSQKRFRAAGASAPGWQRLALLREGRTEHWSDPKWLGELAEAEEKLRNFGAAVEVWKRLVELKPRSFETSFALAHALRMDGNDSASREASKVAVAVARSVGDQDAAALGLGGYYRRKGHWDWAASELGLLFAAKLRQVGVPDPELSDLAFQAGLAHDRCYRWDAAEDYYRFSVGRSAADAYKMYKLGLSLERQQQWHEAAQTHSYAAALSKPAEREYRRYRAAYCYFQEAKYEECVTAYFGQDPSEVELRHDATLLPGDQGHRKALAERPAKFEQTWKCFSNYWIQLADQQEAAGDLSGAEKSLSAAIDRSEAHAGQLYERLARVQFTLGETQAAAASVLETRLFRTPDGIDLRPYSDGSQRAFSAKYVEYRETRPVRPDVVLFESFTGSKVSCNPAAIFRAMVNDPRFSDKLFVWAIETGEHVPDLFLAQENVVVAPRNSDLYQMYLATAGWLINNVTFPPHFVRREGQRYLNTWHGTPIKTLGRDVEPGTLKHSNVARNLLQATHVISPSAWNTEALLGRNDVLSFYSGKVAELGSPRVDRSLQMSAEERLHLRRRLGVADGTPIVLYAPTWRGTQGRPESDTLLAQASIQALEGIDGVHCLFRGHHFSEAFLRAEGLEDRLVPAEIDSNELLAVADVLVTDYSSVFFDYLPLDRPIVFFAPDEREYRKARGLYFEMADLPGPTAETASDLQVQVSQAMRNDTDHWRRVRREWRDRYSPHEDGGATDRAINFFFEGDLSSVSNRDDALPRVLFQTAMFPNGITTSLRNLLASIDPESARLAVILDAQSLGKEESRQHEIRDLPESVAVFGRSGQPAYSAEERWVIDSFNRQLRFYGPELEKIAFRAYEREFRRLFGSTHFDAVVEFEGIAPFWAQLFASAPTATRRLIWQHSDMRSERDARFPQLDAVFHRYAGFDSVVSVSPSIRDLNQVNLAGVLEEGTPAFTAVHNQMDPTRILARSNQPLDSDVLEWMQKTAGHTFVTVGRLSVEKSLGFLLECFARLPRTVESRLIVVGSGALLNDLRARARELKVHDRVLFTGHRSNPMNIVKHSDTFVLTSTHEGQPMVLGEALVLGKHIISTDLPGTRDLLQGGYGDLLEHTVEAFVAAMTASVEKHPAPKAFEARAYMDEALSDFSRVTGVDLKARS
ncbi:CDP-glycerol glycerophosphotransferase family protein [Leucobacter aridicollis]|uniref:CDP-glycerol glycerophosphotransferase family protein n=1 Tax=Leucobacter aridicollis TaxID=283878 RepID=UPI0021686790|nr:CDP-glycerol glycerophosphotransferase family protein [Leucobacter aridicollis]MCS3428663.1 CDP-glycerol glycerophosphotransferase [Leucobacter aridicollis]